MWSIACVAGPPSPENPAMPVPATTVSAPDGSIRSTTFPSNSETNRFPSASNARSSGAYSSVFSAVGSADDVSWGDAPALPQAAPSMRDAHTAINERAYRFGIANLLFEDGPHPSPTTRNSVRRLTREDVNRWPTGPVGSYYPNTDRAAQTQWDEFLNASAI